MDIIKEIIRDKWKIIVAVLAVLIVSVVMFISTQIGAYNRNNEEDIVVDIPQGSSVNTITDILYENELIKNKSLFKIVVRVSSKSNEFKSGTYLFNQTYSNREIIDVLASGRVHSSGIRITIPEGFTSKEIISTLVNNNLGEEEIYEDLVQNPEEFYDQFGFLNEDDIISLEGFLYPDTYYFDEDSSEKVIISRMLSQFDNVYSDDLKQRQKELNMSLSEVVNLASIVEKEAVLDEDRPIIASVFYNRLDIDMALQSDATIQYIFEERETRIMYKHLEIESPYNSYKYKGLPPTPIASPGVKSIEAVLYPADTNYFYFVAKLDGGNNYSETYDQHLEYVNEYREQRDALNNNTESSSD